MPSGRSHAAGSGPSDSANAASADDRVQSRRLDREAPSTRRRAAAQRPTPASEQHRRSREDSARSAETLRPQQHRGRRSTQTLRYERHVGAVLLHGLAARARTPCRPGPGCRPTAPARAGAASTSAAGRELQQRRPAPGAGDAPPRRAARPRQAAAPGRRRDRCCTTSASPSTRRSRPAHSRGAVSMKRCSSARASTLQPQVSIWTRAIWLDARYGLQAKRMPATTAASIRPVSRRTSTNMAKPAKA